MSSAIWLEPLIKGVIFGALFAAYNVWALRRRAGAAAPRGGNTASLPQASRFTSVGAGLLAGILFGLIHLVMNLRKADLIGPGWDHVVNGVLVFGGAMIALAFGAIVARRFKTR